MDDILTQMKLSSNILMWLHLVCWFRPFTATDSATLLAGVNSLITQIMKTQLTHCFMRIFMYYGIYTRQKKMNHFCKINLFYHNTYFFFYKMDEYL